MAEKKTEPIPPLPEKKTEPIPPLPSHLSNPAAGAAGRKAPGDHGDLYPYPPAFPTATVWEMAAQAMRGTLPDKKEAAHCVWHLAGFGLGKWDSHEEGEVPPPVPTQLPAGVAPHNIPIPEGNVPAGGVPMSASQAALFCEEQAKGGQDKEGKERKAISPAVWMSLVPALLDFLAKLRK